jgi:hypothetical protein
LGSTESHLNKYGINALLLKATYYLESAAPRE